MKQNKDVKYYAFRIDDKDNIEFVEVTDKKPEDIGLIAFNNKLPDPKK